MSLFEVLTSCIAGIAALGLLFQIRVAVVSMKADHERRKKQATIEYLATVWRDARFQLESEYGFDPITEDQLNDIKNDHKKEASIRNLLGVLEHVSTGLHEDIYDKDLMYRLSAIFVIHVYHRFGPYMLSKMHEHPTIYIEFKNLAVEFEERKQRESQGSLGMRYS
jgi:uncharacterized protein DUF4760